MYTASYPKGLRSSTTRYENFQRRTLSILCQPNGEHSRSQWPCGLRRGSAVVRCCDFSSNPSGVKDICFECCVLSGTGLCAGLIARPEESYRLWRVVVCDLETSSRSTPMNPFGPRSHKKKRRTKNSEYPTSYKLRIRKLQLVYLPGNFNIRLAIIIN